MPYRTLSDNEAKVIGALLNPNYTYGIRTIRGLVRETGLTEDQIVQVFNDPDLLNLFEYSEFTHKARLHRSELDGNLVPEQLNQVGEYIQNRRSSTVGRRLPNAAPAESGATLPTDFVEGEEI